MDWILGNIPLLVFLFVIIKMIRSVLQAKEARKEQEPLGEETDDQRRVREIQERIRRLAAERRERREEGEEMPPALPPVVTDEPPAPDRRAERAPLPPVMMPTDPFGGGKVTRKLRELKRRAEARPASVAAQPKSRHGEYDLAEVHRQEDLAERMRALEEQRALTQRRATQLAAFRTAESNTTAGRRAEARDELLVNVREPKALRRAILLREVLGTPVGLR